MPSPCLTCRYRDHILSCLLFSFSFPPPLGVFLPTTPLPRQSSMQAQNSLHFDEELSVFLSLKYNLEKNTCSSLARGDEIPLCWIETCVLHKTMPFVIRAHKCEVVSEYTGVVLTQWLSTCEGPAGIGNNHSPACSRARVFKTKQRERILCTSKKNLAYSCTNESCTPPTYDV